MRPQNRIKLHPIPAMHRRPIDLPRETGGTSPQLTVFDDELLALCPSSQSSIVDDYRRTSS
jgi:hypothetical protein